LPPAQRLWERWRPFLIHVLPLVTIFAVVVGAMTGGFATPTEAAALGAAGTILAAMCYRALTGANLMKALTGTVAVSGTILFIILGATTFSQVLSFSGATAGLVAIVVSLPFLGKSREGHETQKGGDADKRHHPSPVFAERDYLSCPYWGDTKKRGLLVIIVTNEEDQEDLDKKRGGEP
jgi:hypothetical protein